MIPDDPGTNNSQFVIYKPPFIFGLLHNEVDKKLPNFPLMSCLI